MKTNLFFILLAAFLLAGCAAKQATDIETGSPSAETEKIGQELESDDLDTSDLDTLDEDLSDLDSTLGDF